jgi:hypothetical protein
VIKWKGKSSSNDSQIVFIPEKNTVEMKHPAQIFLRDHPKVNGVNQRSQR